MYKMKLTCTTYKNKTVELNNTNNEIFMGNVALKDIKHKYFFPCALNKGNAYIVYHFNTAPQADGKMVYTFRRNWTTKPLIKSDDDVKVVTTLNDSMYEQFVEDEKLGTHMGEVKGFEGRVDHTYEQSDIYVVNDMIISPEAKLFKELKWVDCVFLERLTSYTRSFDLSLVMGDSVLSISTIQRKKHLKDIQQMFSSKAIYETGPDPIPWDSMFKRKKADKLSWKDLHDLITQQESEEDESSEWEAGETDDDEEDEYNYSEEEEFDENELKDDIYESESDEDYDAEEAKRVTKKRKH